MGFLDSIRGVLWARRRQPGTVRYWLEVAHERFQPDDLLRQAVEAEEAGFDGIACSDHLAPVVDGGDGADVVRQRVGLARRGRAGDEAAVARYRRHGPASTATTRSSSRSRSRRSRSLAPGRAFLGVGSSEAMNEVPAGARLAVPRGAARADGGGADDHHAPARRRDGRLRRPLLPTQRREALRPPGASAARLHVRLLRGRGRGRGPARRRDLDARRPGQGAEGDPGLSPLMRAGRPRAGRGDPPGRLLLGGGRRRSARALARVEGDDGRRALHRRHRRPGRGLPERRGAGAGRDVQGAGDRLVRPVHAREADPDAREARRRPRSC